MEDTEGNIKKLIALILYFSVPSVVYFSGVIMKEMVKVFKAVADPNRIRILKMLQQKKMCVCELSAVLGITQPSVSRHLSMLRDAGLVRDERDSQWINYELCEEKVNKYAPVLMGHIRKWINEDPRISRDAAMLKTLNREKLCKKV